MRKYCDNCEKEVETKIVTKSEEYTVFSDTVEVEAKVLVCSDCGEELFCEELDNATILEVYEKYRRRHKLLMPEEIKSIREQYELSQRSFAKLLQWGDKTISRYENGSLQDRVHNSLLLFLREPENMRRYLADNEVSLSLRQQNKLLKAVDKLESEGKSKKNNRLLTRYFTSEPCEENGFKKFDYEKFCSMVLFFAYNNHELLKTKLMKLLNYSDMIFFKKNGISISGSKYVHFPYGPVPENFDILLGAMAADGIIHLDISYDCGYEKHQVIPDVEMQYEILTDEEIAVLKEVHEKFTHIRKKDIKRQRMVR